MNNHTLEFTTEEAARALDAFETALAVLDSVIMLYFPPGGKPRPLADTATIYSNARKEIVQMSAFLELSIVREKAQRKRRDT